MVGFRGDVREEAPMEGQGAGVVIRQYGDQAIAAQAVALVSVK